MPDDPELAALIQEMEHSSVGMYVVTGYKMAGLATDERTTEAAQRVIAARAAIQDHFRKAKEKP